MSAPARLLSVRLQGFKSFAERTHVTFGPGISAVVGPNGSGKSNLADALRWALGEQGRALRSRRSEDVIWAGSDRRPAVGMADVQLTLDNADGLLPVEYGVVELGRRLFRSGENEYLLNRQRVRLRDLVDLLDSAHLAENAFLFIGQGMVDQALALRPEERRPSSRRSPGSAVTNAGAGAPRSSSPNPRRTSPGSRTSSRSFGRRPAASPSRPSSRPHAPAPATSWRERCWSPPTPAGTRSPPGSPMPAAVSGPPAPGSTPPSPS